MTLAKLPPPAEPTTIRRSASDSVSSSVPLNRGRRKAVVLSEQPAPAAAKGTSAARIGEIAGGTAAECAAICCCFPCGIVGLVVCAVVKLPAGLCKKAYVKKRRRRIRAMKQKALWGPRVGSSFDECDMQCAMAREEWGIPTVAPSPEEAAMEREMWARFYETGFWRSPSQREDLLPKNVN